MNGAVVALSIILTLVLVGGGYLYWDVTQKLKKEIEELEKENAVLKAKTEAQAEAETQENPETENFTLFS